MTPNPGEPPWYGPVCPVVWEGRHREVPPYPDLFTICLNTEHQLTQFGPSARKSGCGRAPLYGKVNDRR